MKRKNSQYSSTALMALAGSAVVAGLVGRGVIRFRRRFDLRGKTVVLTGGSRGLGIAIAREFAQAGANLAIIARDGSHLQKAREELARRGANVMAIACDVGNERGVFEAVEQIVRHFGTVDVLVNNAGTIQVGPERETTMGDYRDAMDTHFWGPLYFIRAVLPCMRQAGAGRIVNVSSIGGKIAVPHLVPYSASKFALVGLSQGLRSELLRENIFVTVVCPGLMRTGSPRNAKFKGQNQKEYAWFAASDGMPILSISPDRVARRIVDAARHGDGEVIIPWLFNMQAKLHGLAPGFTSEIAALANWLLPGPGGIGERSARGFESDTLQPTFTRAINESAAGKYNQY